MQTLRKILLFLAAAGMISGCTKSKPEPSIPQAGAELAVLKMQCAGYQDGMITLVKDKITLKLKNQSTFARINEVPVTLSSSSKVDSKGIWNLSGTVVRSQLLPVVDDRRFPIRKIVIDPGHGGYDRGAVSVHGTDEKKLNLLLALDIAAELKKNGFEVYLTRKNDRFIPLAARPDIAAKLQADLFVSIHHNSSTRSGAAGLEIFTLNCLDENEIEISGNSSNLASHLYRNLVSLNCFPGRGIKSARFKVLRLAKCPAILVETGFLSNPAEAALVETPFFRREFSGIFARTIADFVR